MAAAAPGPPAQAVDLPQTSAEMLLREFRAVHRAEPLDESLKPATSEQGIRIATFELGATALCLSGGGIRRASLCLGVVQGLAKRKLLSKFDYLSTVSGGGYTGSMLAAWTDGLLSAAVLRQAAARPTGKSESTR